VAADYLGRTQRADRGDASVASIAAAKMLTAVHNNVRFLSIASLPCFFVEPVLSARKYHCPFFTGFQPEVYVQRNILGLRCWQWSLEPLCSTSAAWFAAIA